MIKVFISYNNADFLLASSINQALISNDIVSWFAPDNVKSSEYYPRNIVNAIKTCTVFLLIASEKSLGNSTKGILGSPEVVKELHLASDNKKIIFPVKIDSAIDYDYDYALQYHLGPSQWLDVSKIKNIDKKVKYIVSDVKKILNNPNPKSYILSASDNKQEDILNRIEIILTEGNWKLAKNILNEHPFTEKYKNKVLQYNIFIILQKNIYLKNLTVDSANHVYLSLKELMKDNTSESKAICWYLIANISKNYYQLNAINDPTDGFIFSKNMFKKIPIPRLSARTKMILLHIKDIDNM